MFGNFDLEQLNRSKGAFSGLFSYGINEQVESAVSVKEGQGIPSSSCFISKPLSTEDYMNTERYPANIWLEYFQTHVLQQPLKQKVSEKLKVAGSIV